MTSQEKIRSDIKTFLPAAEDFLVDGLVAKVEEELNAVRRIQKAGRRCQKAAVKRVIAQAELAALGLR